MGIRKTIEQYFTAKQQKQTKMLTNKTVLDKTNLEMRHFNNLLTDF